MLTSTDDMASSRDEIDVVGIDPNEQGSEHAELEVVIDGERVSRLGVGTTDTAFEFFEACLDFPARPIEFDNFFNG